MTPGRSPDRLGSHRILKSIQRKFKQDGALSCVRGNITSAIWTPISHVKKKKKPPIQVAEFYLRTIYFRMVGTG